MPSFPGAGRIGACRQGDTGTLSMKGLRQTGESVATPASAAYAGRRRARRDALVALVVASLATVAWGQAALTPAAAAVGSAAAAQDPTATCVIHSLPACVAQG